MTHTPGPWFVRLTDSTKTNYTVEKVTGDLRSIIAGSNAACLCEEHGGDVLSNARLIASAPDLLNILKDAARMLGTLTGENLAVYARTFSVLAEDVIRKAKGE